MPELHHDAGTFRWSLVEGRFLLVVAAGPLVSFGGVSMAMTMEQLRRGRSYIDMEVRGAPKLHPRG